MNFIEIVNDYIWSNYLIILCISSGIYYSIKYNFLQITLIKDMLKLLFQKNNSAQGISSFQAFTLAISGRIGTGNIAGVATAIAMGGPGALFWMWIIAFLGSASAIIEASLAQLYKEKSSVFFIGGPAFYIKKGLNSKLGAITFSIVTIISTGFLLPSVQSNSISLANTEAFQFPKELVGIILVVLVASIVIGGVKRIGRLTELIVPFMALGYIMMALIIIILNINKLPDIFVLIVSSGTSMHSFYGGIVGSAIAWGIKRGIYSNESGQGTAPHAAAAAAVTHPIKQGLVQGFSVYIDTLFVCTATGLMILFTNQFNVMDTEGGFLINNLKDVQMGPAYTQYAIAKHFPSIGKEFVAISLTFFAFTTILAYYYIAETNVKFLFRKRKWTVYLVQLLLFTSVYLGAITTAKNAWTLGDIGVGLMAWINLISIFLLRNVFSILYKDYRNQKNIGKDPVFDNSKYKIENVDCWNSK